MFWKKKEVKEEVVEKPKHDCTEEGHLYEIVETIGLVNSTKSLVKRTGCKLLLECKVCHERRIIYCSSWLTEEINNLWANNLISIDTKKKLDEAVEKNNKEFNKKPKAEPKKKKE